MQSTLPFTLQIDCHRCARGFALYLIALERTPCFCSKIKRLMRISTRSVTEADSHGFRFHDLRDRRPIPVFAYLVCLRRNRRSYPRRRQGYPFAEDSIDPEFGAGRCRTNPSFASASMLQRRFADPPRQYDDRVQPRRDEAKARSLEAQIARLQIERTGNLTTPYVCPDDLKSVAADVCTTEGLLLQTRRAEQSKNSTPLREKIEERQREFNEAKADAQRIAQGLTLAQQEYDLISPMHKNGSRRRPIS